MSQVTNRPPGPRLVLLDRSERQTALTDLPNEIQFKFQPTDFTIDGISSAWGSSTGMNRAHPILQFSHGDQQGYTFGMKLWADHSEVNVDDQLEVMKKSVLKDDYLSRPPRWQFIWGTFIDETVVVKSISPIKVDELRNDGSIRGCTFSISLLLYKSVDVALVSEDRPSDTFYTVTKTGDQWEDIALREYDEPAYGELLRRRNPHIMFPGQDVGKIVKLPKLANLRNQPIDPDSIQLRRTTESLELRHRMYELRSVPRASPVLKR